MHIRRQIGKLLLVILACTATASADDGNWARFRGPNGAGVSDDAVPVAWSERDYAWKIELPGAGHSSPIVWGDHVFITAADEDAGKRTLVCVNAADGAIRWRQDVAFESFAKHGENTYASSTPAADERHVYLAWTSPEHFEVVAVKHDGKPGWRTDLGPYKSQHGGGGFVIAHGGLVIALVDQDEGTAPSFAAALDAATGDVRWRTPRDSRKFSTSTPCVFRDSAGRDQLIFTTNANGFTALDPATGHILWELPGAFKSRCVSSPVTSGGLIFAGAGEGGRGEAVVAVRPPGAADGSKPAVAYKLTQEVPYVPTIIVYRDHLYTWNDTGTIACHDAATGDLKWRDNVKGGFFGSPICAGGKLYCISKRGEVVVVNASPAKLELLARNNLHQATNSTPAVSKGRLFFRTLTHLICVAKSGEVGRAEP